MSDFFSLRAHRLVYEGSAFKFIALAVPALVLFLHMRIRDLAEFTGEGRNSLDLIVPPLIALLGILLTVTIHRKSVSAYGESVWKIRSELLLNCGMMLFVAIGLTAFHVLRGRGDLLPFWIQAGGLFVLSAGILTMGAEALSYRRHLKHAEGIRLRLNKRQRLDVTPEGTITFPLEESGPQTFRPEHVLGISQDEYGLLLHVFEQGKHQELPLDCEMKHIRDLLRKHTAFYRCSRAWMVNMDCVKDLVADAAGYSLILTNDTLRVHVSPQLNNELAVRLSK
ncbi:MAG: LytTR family transcriptional regulator DNA-binding domain-containing protein [Bacteroidota bacterium]